MSHLSLITPNVFFISDVISICNTAISNQLDTRGPLLVSKLLRVQLPPPSTTSSPQGDQHVQKRKAETNELMKPSPKVG